MHLNCPDCRFPIPSDDVNIAQTIAKCKSCNNIFEFQIDSENRELPARFRKEVIIPPGIEVLHLMEELEIMINWRKSANRFTFFFSLFWNAFIGFMTAMMVIAGEMGGLLFMIPFVLVGAYLLYASVGYLVNTSYITVDEHRISIEHKPISFLIQKDRHFAPEEVEQLFVRKYEVGKTNDRPVYAYAVDLVLKNEKNYTLVKGLHSVNYARYIEQEVEHFLKIKDRPVDGEYDTGV